MCACECAGDAAVVPRQQCLDLGRAFGESTEAGDALAFVDQRVMFARLRVERLQFVDEVPQQVEARFTVAQALFEGGALPVERPPFAVCHAYGLAVACQRTAAVDGGALVAATRQRLELELPMHVDQQLAECTQRLDRHDLAVEVGAATTIRAHHATQLAFAFVCDRLFVEPRDGIRVADDVEGGADFGALRAVADRAAVCATADRQQQRVDEDRFTRAGFAGQHGEAAAEFELDGLDDREVADLQVREHARDRRAQAPGGCPSRVPRPQWSLERRIR
jgi:hypothetical protein